MYIQTKVERCALRLLVSPPNMLQGTNSQCRSGRPELLSLVCSSPGRQVDSNSNGEKAESQPCKKVVTYLEIDAPPLLVERRHLSPCHYRVTSIITQTPVPPKQKANPRAPRTGYVAIRRRQHAF